MKLDLPLGVARLVAALLETGGRPLLVGGAVRDALMGLPSKDYDVEVYGLSAEALERALQPLGPVDAVGQAFTVLKVSRLEGVLGSVDVALPRRDSKVGPGHRGIAASGDPELDLVEATRRRDFTIGAMLFDPATEELIDPFHGQRDLQARVLRAVDAATFAEDPLRALRAVQFAARFEFEVEPETAALCAAMPLGELPAERVFGELEKLLLQARRPAHGLSLLREWKLLGTLAPEFLPLADTPQDPEWHPEGDVWTHTLLAMDQAAALISDLERPRALAVMLGTLCHDLGKPATTSFVDGRIRSRGHEEAGLAPTESFLERLKLYTLDGYDVRAQVLALVGNHLKPGQLYDERERVSDGALRRLARKCEPELLARVARADCLGRTGDFPPVAMDWFLAKVQELDVVRGAPEPLLRGRDLLALGLTPGPRIGEILKAVYERQLDGFVSTPEQALAEARSVLAADPRA